MVLQALAGCEMALRDVGAGQARLRRRRGAGAFPGNEERGPSPRSLTRAGTMKICIYGAGPSAAIWRRPERGRRRRAVDGRARRRISAAMRRNGLKLSSATRSARRPTATSADPEALGPQDVRDRLPQGASGLARRRTRWRPLLGPTRRVVTGQNGVPWWYIARPDRAVCRRAPAQRRPGGPAMDARSGRSG